MGAHVRRVRPHHGHPRHTSTLRARPLPRHHVHRSRVHHTTTHGARNTGSRPGVGLQDDRTPSRGRRRRRSGDEAERHRPHGYRVRVRELLRPAPRQGPEDNTTHQREEKMSWSLVLEGWRMYKRHRRVKRHGYVRQGYKAEDVCKNTLEKLWNGTYI